MDRVDQVTGLKLRIAELELENKNLHETVTFLTRKLFGKSSETSKSLNIEGQMSLFDEAELEADPLFTIESELELLSPEERKIQRHERIKPVLEAFWLWVEANKDNCLPKSKLYKAFTYAINQKKV